MAKLLTQNLHEIFTNYPTINYLEINLMQSNSKSQTDDVNLTESQFFDVLNKSGTNRPSTIKQSVYKYENLISYYDCGGNGNGSVGKGKANLERMQVYHLEFVTVLKYNNYLFSFFVKELKPTYFFPSTTSLHDKYDIERITHRLKNRLYINYEKTTRGTASGYRIYVNYNHSRSVDIASSVLNIATFVTTASPKFTLQ